MYINVYICIYIYATQGCIVGVCVVRVYNAASFNHACCRHAPNHTGCASVVQRGVANNITTRATAKPGAVTTPPPPPPLRKARVQSAILYRATSLNPPPPLGPYRILCLAS